MISAEATAPAIRWRAVTPDDTATLDPMPRALFVGSGGTLALTGDVAVLDGEDRTFAAVKAERLGDKRVAAA